MRHLVNSLDFSKADYDEVTRRAMKFINEGISPDLCRGKIVATLFFQPSTRTTASFQSAMLRAGGGWIGVTDPNTISMGKGETLEDTVREFGGFADVIVLRHQDDDSAERAAKTSNVPLINGGSGSREHPAATVFVIPDLARHFKGKLEGLKIGIYGTPEINRVTKGLVPVLGFYGIDLYIDDLGHFPLPKEVEDKARENGIKNITYGKLEEFIGDIDVLMLTRGLQKGIIPPDKFPKEKEELILKTYKPLDMSMVNKMKKDAKIYMIKPLIFEINREVDSDPRAVYMENEPFSEIALALMTYLLDIKV